MSTKAKRLGNWLFTFTGKKFYPLDPRGEDVCIGDIAHHLSLICRFNGATTTFYSVAQHCVLVSEHADPAEHLLALLHDATEAYCGDLIRPIKETLFDYQDLEDAIWCKAIAPAFGLPATLPQSIKQLDLRALATERRDLMPKFRREWAAEIEQVEPFPEKIIALPPEEAKAAFLESFKKIRP